MSYAIRNTLVLLLVLLIFVGAGWGYIYFVQQPKVDELESQVAEKRTELEEKRAIANQYPTLKNRFDKATEYFNNYDKALYGSSDEDNVFDFLDRINTGSAATDFSFSFSDSTYQEEYGTLNMEVTGESPYSNFVNFIRQIEQSKPLNKVDDITVNPLVTEDSHNFVSFSFSLQSFYDRVALLGEPSLDVTNNLQASIPNPFFPLIRTVTANEDGLLDVESSTLMAISSNRVFMMNQDDTMQQLSPGDRVYLGRLSSINVEQGTATFELNKGGIVERVTLQVNNEDGNQSN